MTNIGNIICIGSMGWDLIGKTNNQMRLGDDIPGKVEIKIGGVAANIAISIADNLPKDASSEIILLSCTGNDKESYKLVEALKGKSINCDHIIMNKGNSDRYIAIESRGNLFGAVACSNQLESVGLNILSYFHNELIQNKKFSLPDNIIIDSNLSIGTLNALDKYLDFNRDNLILACASPYKAKRLLNLIKKCNPVIYLNLEEASVIAEKSFVCSSEAAIFLHKIGAKEAIVTDGSKLTSSKSRLGLAKVMPPKILSEQATGAGDAFLAAHVLSKIINPKFSPTKQLEIATLAAKRKLLEER